MERLEQCGFLRFALMLASVRIAVVVMMAAEPAASERRVPPPGIRVPDEARKELKAGAESLARELDSLRVALKARPDKLELLADVEIFHKAVDWALRYDEIYRSNEVQSASALLSQGKERAAQLRSGEAPWTSMTGLVVRGYVSRIDGSIQPYGLIVPASYARHPETVSKDARPTEYRLDLWLHGRDDHLTELKFIHDRQRSYGEFAPTNAFVLHPYGRYCNAFKFAGEMDIFEALEHVKKQYPIDEKRVALRGFSMGGAGCWHLGAHHAAQWAVVAPGAGFANTADYLKLLRRPDGPPPYEQKLWHLYDATDYALNLFNTTAIAYSGELDKQKAAADAMAAAMKTNGMDLLLLIGPRTEHKYEPETKKELASQVDEQIARGRNPLPRTVRFATWSLRYNQMSWVTVEGLERHWERARVEAEIVNPHGVNIRAENVTGLTLFLPSGLCPLDATLRPEVQVNGQTLETPRVQADGSWKVRLMDRAGRWSVVHSFEEGPLRKRHRLQGPIDDAFMDSFMMVAPTGQAWNESIGRWTTNEMAKAVAEWRNQFRGEPRIKRDDEITDADAAANHLILWGDPQSNKWIGRLVDKLPITWDAKSVRIGKQSFASTQHLPVLVYPNPLKPERYVVLNSGFTFTHPRSASNADQTPKLPDYAVVDLDGPPGIGVNGEVVAAGFFDEQWRMAVE
jgi:hypothetical protein